jgi:hypothetical protein
VTGTREATRTVLRYDEVLDSDNSWRLLDSQDGILVKVRIGGLNYSGTVYLRWRILPSGVDLQKAARRVFVAPADSELSIWITQPCCVAEGLLPLELQLEHAPAWAIEVMSGW